MKNQTLLARGFVEFVVITVGVLVALAIDNAWSAHQDRIDEQAYLSAVLEEIEGNAASMVLTLRAAAAAEASLDRATHILALGVPEDSTSQFLESLIGATSFQTTPVISRAVIQDLISTGNLRLIRDPRIRRELLQIDALSSALIGFATDAEAEVGSALEPLISRHVPPSFTRLRQNDQGNWVVVRGDPSDLRATVRVAVGQILGEPDLNEELNAEYRRIFEGQRATDLLRRRLEETHAKLRLMISGGTA
jgi:hypothetical protein